MEESTVPISDAIVNWNRSIKWPFPKNLCINMMPIRWNFPQTIPTFIHQYRQILERIILERIRNRKTDTRDGQLCFLTIQESWVNPGQTQRRGGLHTDAGRYTVASHGYIKNATVGWGGGIETSGGIFLASNMSNSCAIWNTIIGDFLFYLEI